jgi:outer membrane immunogenic protein
MAGFYVGAKVGGGWSDASIPDSSASGSGASGSFLAGYRASLGPYAWGASEFAYDFNGPEERFSEPHTDFKIRPEDTWSFSLQLGPNFAGLYPGQKFAPYVTGGISYGTFKVSSDFGSDTRSSFGWTVGGGLDYRINQNWLVRSEYKSTWFDSTDFSTVPDVAHPVKEHVQQATFGLIWQPYGPTDASESLIPNWLGKRPETIYRRGKPNWTGFFAGGGFLYYWLTGNWTTTELVTLGLRDPLVNAIKELSAEKAGFDVYWGLMWFLGDSDESDWIASIAADWAYYHAFMDPGIPGAAGLPGGQGGDSVSVRADWSLSLLGRIGYLVMPTVQIYATGGPSMLRAEATLNCTSAGVCGANPIAPFSQTNSVNKFGWTVGAGVEAMLMGNWRGRLEYRHSDYGTYSTSFGAPAQLALAANIKLHTDSVMAGLSYGFGSH